MLHFDMPPTPLNTSSRATKEDYRERDTVEWKGGWMEREKDETKDDDEEERERHSGVGG